jgi:hypothetical protein
MFLRPNLKIIQGKEREGEDYSFAKRLAQLGKFNEAKICLVNI